MLDEIFLKEGIFKNCIKVIKDENGLTPIRFTDRQMKVYAKSLNYKQRSCCPSGVCMDFVTDSSFIKFEYTKRDSVRNWLFFDIYINETFIETFGSAPIDRNSKDFYFEIPSRCEIASKGQSSEKNKAKNRITIYLPHMVDISIKNIELSKGASIEAAKPYGKNLLCLGDSITQGMDSKHPSLAYPVLLSRYLGMNLLNQGVGGYKFDAESLDPEIPYKPDLITVAYGTNVWGAVDSQETLKKNCLEYISKLIDTFPEAKIAVITPLWRADMRELKAMGTFYEACDTIKSVCSEFKQIYILDGLELAPHIPEFYGDRKLHPSGEGFLYMAMNILNKLEKLNIK